MARPFKGIDLDLIEKLAAIHCTNTEIAATVGCDSSLLSKPRYSGIIAKGKERGKTSLRRKMFETAMGGNVTMMIWLSKQLLGHVDKKEIDHTSSELTQMSPHEKLETMKQAVLFLERDIKNGSTASE